MGDAHAKEKEKILFAGWWDVLLETAKWKGLHLAAMTVVSILVAKPGHVLSEYLNRLKKKKNKPLNTDPREGQADFPTKKHGGLAW